MLLKVLQNCNWKLCLYTPQKHNLLFKLLFFKIDLQFIELNICKWKTKFASHKQYSFVPLFSRNVRRGIYKPKYREVFFKSSNEVVPKNLFSSMYLIATTFFNECFFPFDNWKTLFLVKIYCNPKMFFNLDVRLVIFPMSGNNTVQTWDFVDPRFSSWGSDGASLSSTVFSLKNYCETWNKWFCVVFPKSLSFPAFWLEKNQRGNSWEKKLPGYIN